ncbi:oligosaccharide flippase family protein [Rhodobacterales bacterium HKCCE3408]|nr:oligosaccharide flippase family protein [Rhodobacterales bacterium HKCCE3408]
MSIEDPVPAAGGPSGRGLGGRAALILTGNLATALLSLARNLIVARLISIEDYGIAATFALVTSLIELATAFGLQQQIVQAREGDAERWQAALQGFQLLRSFVSATALFFCAGPIAQFFGVPEATWAYRVLAISVVFSGFMHMDVWRLYRQMIYLPNVLSQIVSTLISVVAVWPLWLAFGDYRVMLWALILQNGLQMVMTHLTARRRYVLRFDRAVIAQAMQFGWPLLINNILLFLVMNGEKMIVGREIGLAALAVFAMGFTLTLTPTIVAAKSVQSFFLPQLSAVQDDDTRFQPMARTTIEANLVNGLLLVIAVVLVGEPFVEIALGEKYAALVPLMVWLAILHAMRVFKAGSAVTALARGRTGNAMAANLFRVASLPLAWWAAAVTGDLLLVVLIATAGEVLGVIASLVLVRWRAGVKLGALRNAFAATAVVLSAAALHAAAPSVPALSHLPRWLTTVTVVVLFGAALWQMGHVRAYIGLRGLRHPQS